METLGRDLRKDLEKTVKQARRVAEAGARKVLEQLGVHYHEPYSSMTPEQRKLRNRLRAHGRQLGDRRDRQKGTQTIDHVLQECAYEHWHRMLFARFLAETDLLIEPKLSVAITLEECQELAREQGDDWLELASDYAERMLPQIFRSDDPVLAITLPPETRSELEDLLKALPKDVFTADDSLGWVYQFWQAEKKEEINHSESKIGADELPAATQLFTEDYMVFFLLHNSLGAWWAGKVLADNPTLATSARNEKELRIACKVGSVEWTYLRFVRDTGQSGVEGPWRPAAGTFEGWPATAKELTVIDPCMGSGHFLVFALPILAAFRKAEENLSEVDAVDAVLRDNLFGLEIDPRCTQIAAFNLAFAAWRKTGFHTLPAFNLACSGLAIGVTKTEWINLVEKVVVATDPEVKQALRSVEDTPLPHGLEERVKNGIEALYDLFAKAPWLGSLIDPHGTSANIFRESFDKLEPLLARILSAADNYETHEMAVTAKGMAVAATLLSKRYTLVVTNVPFKGTKRLAPTIQSFIAENYERFKANLATAFIARFLRLVNDKGVVSLVSPHEWLFLISYQEMRRVMLERTKWRTLADIGERGFDSLQAAGAFTALLIIENSSPNAKNLYCGWDATKSKGPPEKSNFLATSSGTLVPQVDQLSNPDFRIGLSEASDLPLLRKYAGSYVGFQNGDTPRFVTYFWEVPLNSSTWRAFQLPCNATKPFGGRSGALRWEEGEGVLANSDQAHVTGVEAWGKVGIAIRQTRSLPATRYTGDFYDQSSAAIIPYDPVHLPAIWEFCSSNEFHDAVRKIDKKKNVTNATFVKIPFDLDFWNRKAKENFPNGLPKPESKDPTQWLFKGSPAECIETLQVATARLAGFLWPRQIGVGFMDTPAVSADVLQNHADEDGIVCLTALKGEAPAEQRLKALLSDALDRNWSAAGLAGHLSRVDFSGKSLDDWLRDGFFEQHCALFQQRPFIWHIWDGRQDGFHALVNYHRLAAPNGEGRRTFEKLIYSYLGDWIDRQRMDQTVSVEGADARLAHAEHLRAELIKILEGEAPYDIFVRWKPLHQQPIGWGPDINDGVRVNIRPFMIARPLGARTKNACIFRSTPKIKWTKDRGKEVMQDKKDYPWLWDWDEVELDFPGRDKFDGNRWNNVHYSNAFKQAARVRASVKAEGNK